jgi:hypothetical protein
MITIRLSDQEYGDLKKHCVTVGEFNVSEFVRAATMHALTAPELSGVPTYLDLKVAALCSRVEKLEQRLAGVTALENRLLGARDIAQSHTQPEAQSGVQELQERVHELATELERLGQMLVERPTAGAATA